MKFYLFLVSASTMIYEGNATDVPVIMKNISKTQDSSFSIWLKPKINYQDERRVVFGVTFQPDTHCRDIKFNFIGTTQKYHVKYRKIAFVSGVVSFWVFYLVYSI